MYKQTFMVKVQVKKSNNRGQKIPENFPGEN